MSEPLTVASLVSPNRRKLIRRISAAIVLPEFAEDLDRQEIAFWLDIALDGSLMELVALGQRLAQSGV